MPPIDDKTRWQIINRVLKARARRTEFLISMQQRQQRGWQVAVKCARILKEEFGVQRVVLFGSMLDLQQISPHSDIDLAVWGLPEQDFLRAGATIERGHDFTIDLVEFQKAKAHILQAIEQGIEI